MAYQDAPQQWGKRETVSALLERRWSPPPGMVNTQRRPHTHFWGLVAGQQPAGKRSGIQDLLLCCSYFFVLLVTTLFLVVDFEYSK